MADMDAVRAAFRRSVGREPTSQELETLTPLYMRAGYSDDELLWGIVFLFARQFGLASAASNAIEKMTTESLATVDKKLVEVLDVVKRASRRAASDKTMERWFAWVLILNILIIGVGGVVIYESNRVDFAAAYAAGFDRGMHDVEFTAGMLRRYGDFLGSPLGQELTKYQEAGLGYTLGVVKLLQCGGDGMTRTPSAWEGEDICELRYGKAERWTVPATLLDE